MLQPLFVFGSLALAGALLHPPVPTSSSVPKDGAYQIDAVHSSVLFSTIHFGASRFYGRFNKVSGSIEFDPAKPGDSQVAVEIDVASVDTHDKKRDQHMRGPDFLAAKEFPTMVFTSRSVRVLKKAKGDQPLVLEVAGDLELGGKERAMTIEVVQVGDGTSPGGAELVGFETRFSIKRSEFGIDYMVGPIGDEVEIILSLEANR